MKNKSRIAALTLLLLTFLTARGQESSFQPVKDPAFISAKIEEANQGISTLRSSFTQEKELSFLEEKAYSSGKFYFAKDNRIRWEYEEPYSYVIIMNGSLITILDEGKTNTLDASSNRLFNSINTIMAGIIDGSVLQQQGQFKSTFYENDRLVKVILEPLISGMSEFITVIELEINRMDYTVDALKIVEVNGDYTLIAFENKKLNASLSEAIFSPH